MISVIVPLYNKEKYIKKTIDSILNQSFKDFEILVVDDGSTDKSVDIVKSYTDDRVKLIMKKNGGVSSARNFGILKSNGEWLIFLDADDEFEPGSLEAFYNSTKLYTDIKVIVSNFWIVSTDGTRKVCSKWKNNKILRNPLKNIWYKEIYSRPGNTLIHKDVFKTHVGYIENMSYNEDYEFSLRILSYYKVLYIPYNSMSYFKVDEGASVRLHSEEKDFAYMVPSMANDSLYKKLILYNVANYNLTRRKGSNSELSAQQNLCSAFNKNFKLQYFIFALIRKLFY